MCKAGFNTLDKILGRFRTVAFGVTHGNLGALSSNPAGAADGRNHLGHAYTPCAYVVRHTIPTRNKNRREE
jgi:hypothetical protein